MKGLRGLILGGAGVQFFFRHWRRIAILLLPLALFLAHAIGGLPIAVVVRLDELFYDTRLRLKMPFTLDERVVIADIDEKTLSEFGRWPWARDVLAELTQRLFDEHHIAALGFDILFAEAADRGSERALVQLANGPLKDHPAFSDQVAQLRRWLDQDARFAEALRGRPVALGYYFSNGLDGLKKGGLPKPVMPAVRMQGRRAHVLDWDGYGANIESLAEAAPVAGFFNSVTDPDGSVRSLPLIAQHEGQYYESLALAVFRLAHDMPAVYPQWASQGHFGAAHPPMEAIEARSPQGQRWRFPVDDRATVLVPYRGAGGPGGGSFRYISVADVLSGRLPSGSLKDTIVLVGSTAPGLLDLRSTPVDKVYPGVEVHASVISGMLDGRMAVRPDYADGYEALVLLVAGLALALALPVLSAGWSILLILGLLSSVLALNLALYVMAGLALPVASAVLLILLTFALDISYGYWVESRAKRELANLFGTYVPPPLVDQMLRSPKQYSMRATSRRLTLMFCDLRGFTRLSEGMTPEELQALLNDLFSRLSLCIGRHQGTIDKYMGDCIMAFWGAPVDLPDPAGQALQAALDMLKALEGFNVERQQAGLSTLGVGIGLNTGWVSVGDMGSDVRRSYTAIGDPVNLAARLQGLSGLYGVPLIVSEFTMQEIGLNGAWIELDRVRVVGKRRAVSLYTPMGAVEASGAGQDDVLRDIWPQCLSAYRARDWDRCDELLRILRARRGPWSTLHDLYADRVANFRRHPPPPDWDGVFELDSRRNRRASR